MPVRSDIADIEGITSAIRNKLSSRSRFDAPRDEVGDLQIRDAAVLIGVLNRDAGPSLLFVERTDRVPTHKGQIAFPGGAIEEGESVEDAALREAHEEVALAAERVEVVGWLDDLLTVSNFIITPVVGIVREPPDSYVKQEFEVENVFETPLSHLLDPANFRTERVSWELVPPSAPIDLLRKIRIPALDWDPNADDFPMFFFDTPDGTIWGATAVILKQFLTITFGFGG